MYAHRSSLFLVFFVDECLSDALCAAVCCGVAVRYVVVMHHHRCVVTFVVFGLTGVIFAGTSLSAVTVVVVVFEVTCTVLPVLLRSARKGGRRGVRRVDLE